MLVRHEDKIHMACFTTSSWPIPTTPTARDSFDVFTPAIKIPAPVRIMKVILLEQVKKRKDRSLKLIVQCLDTIRIFQVSGKAAHEVRPPSVGTPLPIRMVCSFDNICFIAFKGYTGAYQVLKVTLDQDTEEICTTPIYEDSSKILQVQLDQSREDEVSHSLFVYNADACVKQISFKSDWQNKPTIKETTLVKELSQT